MFWCMRDGERDCLAVPAAKGMEGTGDTRCLWSQAAQHLVGTRSAGEHFPSWAVWQDTEEQADERSCGLYLHSEISNFAPSRHSSGLPFLVSLALGNTATLKFARSPLSLSLSVSRLSLLRWLGYNVSGIKISWQCSWDSVML